MQADQTHPLSIRRTALVASIFAFNQTTGSPDILDSKIQYAGDGWEALPIHERPWGRSCPVYVYFHSENRDPTNCDRRSSVFVF